MPPIIPPDEDALADQRAPARCATCGRRAGGTNPGCSTHGCPSSGGPRPEVVAGSVDPDTFPGYQTREVLGRGGFGTVFAALPKGGSHKVAIKLARSDRYDSGPRLLREIQALTAVGPPHVPVVYASGRLENGSPYVVMEYLESPMLADHLVRTDDLSLADRVALGLATLPALEAVHARGFVHRDLKPENLFVDDQLRAKVIDFGLVTWTAGTSVGPGLTMEGAAIGTAEYMAPEQCEGRTDIDARADIYSIGIILYELIAGNPPFWGPAAIVHRDHVQRRPPRFAAATGVPASLEDAVLRCLAKDRDDRFQTVTELRSVLEEALTRYRLGLRVASFPRLPMPSSPEAETPATSQSQERLTVSLLRFESDADAVAVQREIEPSGGHLAHGAQNRYVVIYTPEGGDNPARRALQAAQEIVRGGLCERVLVDLALVSVQRRRDGSRRFLGPALARPARYPPDAGPSGVFLTPAAADVLPDGGNRLMFPSPDAGWGPLMGRDDLLEGLLLSARKAADEALPTLISVIGDTGYGKSHLRAALLDRLRARSHRGAVIDLTAPEPTSGSADHAVRELLQQALELPIEPAQEAGGPSSSGGVRVGRGIVGPTSERGIAEVGPAVALALGWITPDAPELRALEAAPGALRQALIRAAGEALRARAARGPLFVLLDDAHLADEVTLGALEYAALAEARVPVWVCALSRPTFEQTRPAWGERASVRAMHRLGPLDPASAAALCRRLLLPVANVPEPAVLRLIERTQAVPLLLVELVRGLKREGIVRRHPKGDAWYLATDELDRLPDLPLIEWLARREVDALAPALASHARLIALLGPGVTIPEVDGVLRRLDRQGNAGEFPLDARVGIQRLLAAGVLVQGQQGHIGFRHELIRDSVAQSIPAPLRRQIHLAAVDHYREGSSALEARRLSQIAFHAARAGLGRIAENAYLTLAEQARARHAYLEAERLYSRALELSAGPGGARGGSQSTGSPGAMSDVERAAHRGRGLMRYRLGRYHDALADLARAQEAANQRSDHAAAMALLLDQATVLDWMDEFTTSHERVKQAMELSPEVGSKALHTGLLLGIGRSLHRHSREKEAAECLEKAVRRAEQLGDEGYEPLVISLLMLGFILQGLGRLDDAGRALDRAIALSEEHGDTMHLVSAVANRALLRALLGDKAEMIAGLTRVLSLARELGQVPLELIAYYNLGEYLYLMDDLEAAEPHVDRAVAIERQRMGDDARPVVALLAARLRLYRGEEEHALALLDSIRSRQTWARAADQPNTLMVPSEGVFCTMIDLATRGADDAEWDALEAESERFSIGQEYIEVLEMRAVSALRRGLHEQARRQLEKALAAADRIPNVMRARLERQLAAARAQGPNAK